MRARSLLALVPLIALVGCNGAQNETAADPSPPASAATTPAVEGGSTAPAPVTSDPAPPPPPGQTDAAAPAAHPAAGFWDGPNTRKGSRQTVIIGGDGTLHLRSDGILCKGNATFAPHTFELRLTQCMVPLPPLKATLSPDRQQMIVTDGNKKETWRRSS